MAKPTNLKYQWDGAARFTGAVVHEGTETFNGTVNFNGDTNLALSMPAATELTIATGVVAKTADVGHFTIDTEADAATDNLATMTGGVEGDIIFLRPANAARTVVIDHSIVANGFACPNGQAVSLENATDYVMCLHNGSQWTVVGVGKLAEVATELTIATGAVAASLPVHTVDTEADAASDALTTITGGAEGQYLLIRPANAARTVVVTHGIGANLINCPGAIDISLAEATDHVLLAHDGTQWNVVGFNTLSDTGGGLGATLAAGTLPLLLNDGVNLTLGTGSDATLDFDATRTAVVLDRVGVKAAGFNGQSDRFELKWVAGQRGKPGLNADIQNAAEATRMVTDPDFEVLGTNASSDDVTFYAEGGIALQTDGADGDEVILLPHLDANQTAWTQVTWGTDQEVVWECLLETHSDITNSIIWAGLKLTNTEVTATDNDQCFFRYEDGVATGNWQAISSIADSDDAADSGVTVAVSTKYHLMIKIQADLTALMYINGVLVETTAALTTATDLIPYIGVAADGAAEAKTLYVYGQSISRNLGA